jgi:MATE family multidrug resistance protein
VLVNLYFNYGFVFGEWGLPKLDVAGLAWASFGVRFFMGFALLLMISRKHKVFATIDWSFCREVLGLSIPIALAVFFEVMAFCSVTLFVGRFGPIQTAANNLALTLGSLTFMIPLSISSAAAVKVGHAYGERSFSNVKTYILVSLLVTQLFMLFSAAMYFTVPGFLLGLFTQDAQVLFWGMQLLFLVGFFQFFDGAQVILAGVLRGLSVTRPASIAIFIGYWIIGIPLGYFFAFKQGLESKGMWMGLVISLAVVAVMLSLILKKRVKALHQEGL